MDYVFDEETEQFKRKNKIKKIKLDILFIDESSMLSTGVTGFKVDGEKTFLLDELIKKLKNEEIKKIIFVAIFGDMIAVGEFDFSKRFRQ